MNNLFPLIKKVSSKELSDEIIGVRPNESMAEAIKRFTKELRIKKLKEIFGK